MKLKALAIAALVSTASMGFAADTPSNPDAKVYFVNVADGGTVKAGSTINFGLSGMGIAPAGTEAEMTGHHHILIDRPELGKGEDGADEFLYGLPADENHVHFGKGQTEWTVNLAPGQHTLQLVPGDLNHVPHNPPIFSDVITITVE